MYTHKHIDKEDGSYRRWWNITDNFGFRFGFYWKSSTYHIDPFWFDDDDGEWGTSLGIKPILITFAVKLPRWARLKHSRTLGFSFHSGAIWWDLWVDPMGDYPCPYGKWRDSNFNFSDFLFGRNECSKEVLEEREVLVPMPEKSYEATAKLMKYTWRRPRWFAKTMKRVEIDVPEGIPHEGKGTCAHNCGRDATFGMTTGECRSIPEGVGKLVGSVLRDRVRYGGWGDWNWAKPRD